MNLADLSNQDKIKPHRTSKNEVQNLINAIERDMIDAVLPGLSSDRKFCIAYNAVLLSATIILNCSGYRTIGGSHHLTTIRSIPLILGENYLKLSRYFDHCRYKRNLSDYERVGVISNKESKELLNEADKFFHLIKEWLKNNYPQYI